MVKVANIDFETFSEVDLTKVGSHRYAMHPSTEVLMCAWCEDNGDIQQWVPAEGQQMPDRLRALLLDPTVLKRAHNAAFELAICAYTLKLPVDPAQWRCTMALGLSLALPGKLEKLGEAVALAQDKKKDGRGKLLIRKFCMPRKPTKTKPHTRANKFTDHQDWEDFKFYNRQDIVAEVAILSRIKKWDLSDEEQAIWVLDQKINNRGIPFNRAAIMNAIKIADAHQKEATPYFKEVTGLDNPNSTQQLLPWLRAHGYPYEDLKKGHIDQELERVSKLVGIDDTDPYYEALVCRSELSGAAVKKYYAVAQRLCEDDTLKGCFQYAGASRTSRWGGRGFQPQNLMRAPPHLEKRQHEMAKDLAVLDLPQVREKYGNPLMYLGASVRTVVQAPQGFLLADADLSAIENRVLGWVCEDEKILSVFEKGRDPYLDFAQYLFGQDYEILYAEYKEGKKQKRTIAKPAVLGAGYALGVGEIKENPRTGEIEATGLLGYARNMGINMTPEESAHSIEVFRTVYSGVTDFWKVIERAAKTCVRTGKETHAGMLVFKMEGPFLRMYLPSGRAISYCRPRLAQRRTPWGEMRESITYQQPGLGGGMQTTDTYYGKLVENAVQAIARDILANGLLLAEKAGLDVFMHVHDQITCLVPENQAEEHLATLIECMETVPAWATGLPLAAEGHTTWCFIKD
jgi:DNA polymerase